MENKKNNLSMGNFKNTTTGELVDPSTLSKSEQIDFHLALLMKGLLELLELSVTNDRVFSRLKFEVMAKIHACRDNLDGIK